jgi:ATP-dependent helicase/nuclease subunit B
VPTNALEERERDRLLPQLQHYLEQETHLLPTFQPRSFEWAFGQDRPFSYAGCNLTGAVDRIDVDDEGNAVVIDYKSSLSNAYRLHLDPNGKQAKDQAKQAEAERRAYMAAHGGLQPPADAPAFELPAKMQALIYAKVVRDTLGLNVVASLYLNPLDGSIMGAYDAQRVGPEQIPFAKDADARACAVPFNGIDNFDALIAASEEAVANRMAHLAAGEVFPHPHGPDACQYCPVGNCPQRLVERKH